MTQNTKTGVIFEPSDCKTLLLWEKGQILFLSRDGKTIQEIVDITTRSVDWCTNIVGALMGSDVENELINIWREHERNIIEDSRTGASQDRATEEDKRTAAGRTIPGATTTRGKASAFGEITKRISGPGTGRSCVQSKNIKRSSQSANNFKGKTLVDKVRKSKDYKEVK